MIHEIYIGDSLNISTDRQMYTILLYSRKRAILPEVTPKS